MPALSQRRNTVVIADEAHRSQYDLIDGFARHMRDALPNASFMGFIGTPIEKNDANTRAVFGDYISVYDLQQAVADKATVPIYYESRIAKLRRNDQELPNIDEEFKEITEGEEEDHKRKLQTKWAALEALVGDPKRIELVAADLVKHYEKRLESLDGKAMVVCMSRSICVDLHNAIINRRPEWASAADGPEWQPHTRNKPRRTELATRFKDPKDSFRIVIVRDMWLTGFDAPCLHTMHVDKPMCGHGLMQAIELLPAAQEHILPQQDGKKRFVQVVVELSRALALCAASDEATEIRYDIAFFQAVQASLSKRTGESAMSPE